MTGTLLFRLEGLQSWGVYGTQDARDSLDAPSLSGVVGFLANALGRKRGEDLSDLSSLTFGVRVDREGVPSEDFQMVGGAASVDGKKLHTAVRHKRHLEDAVFLAGLYGELALLRTVHEALKHPARPLFLGRKSQPPFAPPYLPDGIKVSEGLETALRTYPWLVAHSELKTVLECPAGLGLRLILPGDEQFHPSGPDPLYRWRGVRTDTVRLGLCT